MYCNWAYLTFHTMGFRNIYIENRDIAIERIWKKCNLLGWWWWNRCVVTQFFYIHSYPELKQHQTTATSLYCAFFSEWACVFSSLYPPSIDVQICKERKLWIELIIWLSFVQVNLTSVPLARECARPQPTLTMIDMIGMLDRPEASIETLGVLFCPNKSF